MQPDLDRMRDVILDLMAKQMCPDGMFRVLGS
jgi:hypothetical protein